MFKLILAYAVPVWLASLALGPALDTAIANKSSRIQFPVRECARVYAYTSCLNLEIFYVGKSLQAFHHQYKFSDASLHIHCRKQCVFSSRQAQAPL